MSNDTGKTIAWITKWALSTGVFRAEGKEAGGGMFRYEIWGTYVHGEGIEWHRTRESAVKRAEEMRFKKIQSLEKQLAKLRSKEIIFKEGVENNS